MTRLCESTVCQPVQFHPEEAALISVAAQYGSSKRLSMTRRYERCKVPALFLFGDHDQLIPVDESVVVIQRVLAEDKHHDFTIRVFPNVDHEMRLLTVQAMGAIDPEYLTTMRGWLSDHVLN